MQFLATDLLLGISFFVISVLATYLFLKSQDRSGKMLAYASYAAAFWILTIFAFEALGEFWGRWVLYVARAQYAVGALLLLFYFSFAYVWGSREKKWEGGFLAGGSAAWVLFAGLILFTGAIIEGVEIVNGHNYNMVLGRHYFIFIGYFWLLVGAGYYHLIRKLLIAKEKTERMQLIYILTGSTVMGGVSFLANIFLLLFGEQRFIWAGPVSAIVFTIIALYAIARHHLFNIKVIATEFLTFAILTTIFVEIFTTDDFSEVVLRMILFVVVGIFSVFLLKSVYREIEQRRKIEELAAQLSDFVSFVTHELRGPVGRFKWNLLTTLGGNYGSLSPEIEKHLQGSFDLAVEMGHNIETFLSFNKLKIGRLELVKQEVDLRGIVAGCLSEFEGRARAKGVSLVFEEDERIFKIAVDKFQICHVVNNLIDNAIKYTPEGGRVRVDITADKKNENIIFSIEDSGIGIPQNVLPMLFAKYERGAEEAKMFAKGSGIGLFLAKKIVELHDGKIWAESAGESRGSKFSFSLPVGKNDVSL